MERWLRDGAFEGETHIVTGAGQGIGQCVATALAVHGAQVALVDLDPGRVGEVRDEIAALGAPEPLAIGANVADAACVAKAPAQRNDALARLSEPLQQAAQRGHNVFRVPVATTRRHVRVRLNCNDALRDLDDAGAYLRRLPWRAAEIVHAPEYRLERHAPVPHEQFLK